MESTDDFKLAKEMNELVSHVNMTTSTNNNDNANVSPRMSFPNESVDNKNNNDWSSELSFLSETNPDNQDEPTNSNGFHPPPPPTATNNKDKTLVCDDCEKCYTNRFGLIYHLQSHRNGRPLHQCYNCGICFPKAIGLERHILTHLASPYYLCTQCPSIFHSRSELVNHHNNTGHIIEKRIFVNCKSCGQSLRNYQVRSHQWICTGKQTFTCKKCSLDFDTKSLLEEHTIVNHNLPIPGTSKEFEPRKRRMKVLHVYEPKCVKCEQTFESKELLFVHKKSCNKVERKEQIPCVICNKHFPDYAALYRHRKIDHCPVDDDSNIKLSQQCPVCENPFRTSYELKQHMRVHTGEKPFVCGVCDRRFAYRHVLKVHMQTHTGEQRYRCTNCYRRFTKFNGLKYHLMRCHGIEEGKVDEGEKKVETAEEAKEEAKYEKCKICGEVFKFPGLIRHMVIHSRSYVAKFRCSICLQTFNMRQQLKYHIRSHTGEKPYKCRFCDVRFRGISKRKSHEEQVHMDRDNYTVYNFGHE